MSELPKNEKPEELCRVRDPRSTRNKGVEPNIENDKIYIGPSVEGPDVEYIARVSGKVSNRKPSFAK